MQRNLKFGTRSAIRDVIEFVDINSLRVHFSFSFEISNLTPEALCGYDVPGDQIELGVWFHPEGYEAEFEQDLKLYTLRGDIALPPQGINNRGGRSIG